MTVGDRREMVMARWDVPADVADTLLSDWDPVAASRGLNRNQEAYWREMATFMSAAVAARRDAGRRR